MDQPRTDVDQPLVARAQAGDAAAFDDLVVKYSPRLYGLVYNMTSNHEDTNDMLQDVFAKAYRSIKGFRGKSSFYTWIHTIAVNMTLKHFKKMKRQSAVSIDDPAFGLASAIRADSDPSPAESLQQRERNDMVRRAIDTLPDKQRIVVVMHYFEQRSCEEIAEILKCSVGTVWSRLHYACRKLRGELHWLEQGY